MGFKKSIVIALILGAVITGLTGLLNSTPNGLIGATWHGWPMAWAVQLSGAYGAPWTLNYLNLVIDFVVWFVVAFIVLFIVMRRKK